jgi:hypothetical protein
LRIVNLYLLLVPRTLVIHLKRFDNFQRKIKKYIKFEQELTYLNKFLFEKSSENYRYKLYSVLVHDGFSINSGHYYCYVKGSNDLWYCMNDSYVSRVSEKEVLQQTPYLLFYERVLDKPVKPINLINHEIKKHEEMLSSLDTSTSDNFTQLKVSPFNTIDKFKESEPMELQKQLLNNINSSTTVSTSLSINDNNFTSLPINPNEKDIDRIAEEEHILLINPKNSVGYRPISRRLNKIKSILKQLRLNRKVTKQQKIHKPLTPEQVEIDTNYIQADTGTNYRQANIGTNYIQIMHNEDNKIKSWKLKELYGSDTIERWEDSETETDSDKLKQQINFVKSNASFKQKVVPKKNDWDINYDIGKLKKVKVKKQPVYNTNYFQNIHNRLK